MTLTDTGHRLQVIYLWWQISTVVVHSGGLQGMDPFRPGVRSVARFGVMRGTPDLIRVPFSWSSRVCLVEMFKRSTCRFWEGFGRVLTVTLTSSLIDINTA